MGVSKLRELITSLCDYEKINLTDLASTSEEKIAIVVDGSCFIYQMVQRSGFDSYSGGDYEQQLLYIVQLLDSFKNSGIYLTVVLDGCSPAKKDQTSHKRRVRKMAENRKIFQGTPFKPHSKSVLKPSTFFELLFLSAAEKFDNIEIITAPFESDPFSAKIAQELVNGKHKYMGVVTNDSDFMIYDSAGFIGQSNLIIKYDDDIKKHNVLISRCTPDMIKNALGLSHTSMIPILACLAGNDYIDVSKMSFFHQKLEDDSVKDQKQEDPVQQPVVSILITLSKFISEYFDSRHLTVNSATASTFFKSLFRNEEKRRLCNDTYNEYNVRELTDDHPHFSYEQLMKTYIPFNPKGTLEMSTEEHHIVRSGLLLHYGQQMKKCYLSSDMVTMTTRRLTRLPVLLDDPDAVVDTNDCFAELRRRFYTFVFFHDVNNKFDTISILEKQMKGEGSIEKKINVSAMMFNLMYGSKIDYNVEFDARTELLRIYGVNANSFNKMIKLLSENVHGRRQVDAHAIALIVINIMFTSRLKNDKKIENWEYQCLLASLCYRPFLNFEDPVSSLVESKNKPRFITGLYTKRNMDVLNIFLSSNHLQLVARFLYGLKLFTQYNTWFGYPFDNKSIVNCVLLFDGSRFARIYKRSLEFVVKNGSSRCNVRACLNEDCSIVYDALVQGLEAICDPGQ